MRPREKEQDNLQISLQDLNIEKILVEVGHLRQQVEFCMNRIAGAREGAAAGSIMFLFKLPKKSLLLEMIW